MYLVLPLVLPPVQFGLAKRLLNEGLIPAKINKPRSAKLKPRMVLALPHYPKNGGRIRKAHGLQTTLHGFGRLEMDAFPALGSRAIHTIKTPK